MECSQQSSDGSGVVGALGSPGENASSAGGGAMVPAPVEQVGLNRRETGKRLRGIMESLLDSIEEDIKGKKLSEISLGVRIKLVKTLIASAAAQQLLGESGMDVPGRLRKMAGLPGALEEPGAGAVDEKQARARLAMRVMSGGGQGESDNLADGE